MPDALFSGVDQLLARGATASTLDFLIENFRSTGRYPLLFEARLMKKRLELGLPLIQTTTIAGFPAETRKSYEDEMVEAARETGALFLAEENIPRAWPYFRAIGEPAVVKEALNGFEPGRRDLTELISTPFHETVHPPT